MARTLSLSENKDIIFKVKKKRLKPQLSHLISKIIAIVVWLPNINLIEPKQNYKQVSLFFSYSIWFFFKLTQ